MFELILKLIKGCALFPHKPECIFIIFSLTIQRNKLKLLEVGFYGDI